MAPDGRSVTARAPQGGQQTADSRRHRRRVRARGRTPYVSARRWRRGSPPSRSRLHPDKMRLIQFRPPCGELRGARSGFGKSETIALPRLQPSCAGKSLWSRFLLFAPDAPPPHGGEAQRRKGGTAATEASAAPSPGRPARTDGKQLLQLPRGADQRWYASARSATGWWNSGSARSRYAASGLSPPKSG